MLLDEQNMEKKLCKSWNMTFFFSADERGSVGEPVYDMDHLATFTVDTYNRGE